MTVRLPSTDARRAAVLRAELDRAGSAMVPGWGVGVAPGSFGRALLEIAARFAEETSSRLDRTAERDALAFYDTLDVPPPAPQAATATLVFVTEEARTTTTSAPLRVQVGATVEDQEVIFETTRALEVSPARIAEVVAVDPDTDHIERAPGRVVATERPPDPVGGRLLVTAASAGSTIVQIAPAIGLEPGDQLRIQGTAYRIASVSQDLVTLVDPLAAAVPAGTPFQRIEALEAFTLRDLQQHACYVGHTSLLNLERPARIELVLTPSGLAARLAALDLRYSLWGTKDGEDEPAWQALELVGGSATTLTVRKRWEGSVDEVEVDGRKSRWLRIEHPQPITTVGVGAHADRVRLTVRSEDTVAATSAPVPDPIGSRTITNAFHNAAPLAVTGRFLPFGPTPARFDIFSFAAPEALSKPGARVDLDIRVADASLLALVAPVNAQASSAGTLAYGIGAQRPAPLGDDLDRSRRALAGAAQPGRRRRCAGGARRLGRVARHPAGRRVPGGPPRGSGPRPASSGTGRSSRACSSSDRGSRFPTTPTSRARRPGAGAERRIRHIESRSPAAGRRRPAPDVRAGHDRAARRGMGHRWRARAPRPRPRPARGDGAGAAGRHPGRDCADRDRRRPRRGGRHGVVRPDRCGARRPRGRLDAVVRRGRPRRRPPRRHLGSAPERSVAALGGVGRRRHRDRRLVGDARRHQRRPPRCRRPRGSTPRPGARCGSPPSRGRPRRPSRSPPPSPATTRGTARSWCGSTKDRPRRHRCPPTRPTGRRPTW